MGIIVKNIAQANNAPTENLHLLTIWGILWQGHIFGGLVFRRLVPAGLLSLLLLDSAFLIANIGGGAGCCRLAFLVIH